MTVSALIAHDRLTVAATATCYPSVGTIVPATSQSAAAVSQAAGDRRIAAKVLELIEAGSPAQEAVEQAVDRFPAPETRQVAAITVEGGVGHLTGAEALPARGVLAAQNALVCGNMLEAGTLEAGLSAMLQTPESSGPLRAITALESAFEAGGDLRGAISSAVRARGATVHHGVPVGLEQLEVRIDWSAAPVTDLRAALTQKLSYLLVENLSDPTAPLPSGLEDKEGVETLAWKMLDEDPDGSAAVLLCLNVISGKLQEVRAGRALAEKLARQRPGPGCTQKTVDLLWN